MNCINCYQEIPDGSKFCPHCGSQQPETPGADQGNTQPETPVQADTAVQHNNAPYQNTQYQSDPYQSAQYQSAQYQTPPVYQSSYEPQTQINWVPYLVLSIISTVCCCLPFGIVAIVYATKINSSVTAGDTEGAERAARTARIWIIVSAVVGIIAILLYILLFATILEDGYYYYNYYNY